MGTKVWQGSPEFYAVATWHLPRSTNYETYLGTYVIASYSVGSSRGVICDYVLPSSINLHTAATSLE